MSNSCCASFLGDGGRPLRGLLGRDAFLGGIGFGGESGIEGFRMDRINGSAAWHDVSAIQGQQQYQMWGIPFVGYRFLLSEHLYHQVPSSDSLTFLPKLLIWCLGTAVRSRCSLSPQ